MYGCTVAAKSLAYKALVRPCLEYGCIVWSSCTSKHISSLESVQRRAAQWIMSRWTKSSDACLEELSWPTLELHCCYLTILMIHSILHKQSPIDPNNRFQFNILLLVHIL